MRWKIYAYGSPIGRRRISGANPVRVGQSDRCPVRIYTEYPFRISVDVGSRVLNILALGCQYELCACANYAAIYTVTPAVFHHCARQLTKWARSAHLLRAQPYVGVTVHLYSDRRQNNTIKMQITHSSCINQELIFFREHLRLIARDLAKGQKITQNIYLRPSCRNLCRLPNQKEHHNVESTDECREAGGP